MMNSNFFSVIRKFKLQLKTSIQMIAVLMFCQLMTFLLLSGAVAAQPLTANTTYEVTYSEAVASLQTNRDRLLQERALATSTSSAAEYWQYLNTVQKGVFLTLTDYLGRRSFLYSANNQPRTNFDTMLNHVTKIYAVNGTLYNNGDCGGIESHRMYFQVDDALMYNLRNVQFLPNWRVSTDLAGPHNPFTQSREGVSGKPRAQTQEWAYDFESQTLYRPGVSGVNDPHIVEMDIDYDFLHHSNPECNYDGVYGRTRYQNFYYNYGLGGSAEYDYTPSSMPIGPNPVGNVDGLDPRYPPILRGWTLVPSDPQPSRPVKIFIDSDTYTETSNEYVTLANLPRPDVNETTHYPGNHGFEFAIPSRFCDGNTHYYIVYGMRVMYDYQYPSDRLHNGYSLFTCNRPVQTSPVGEFEGVSTGYPAVAGGWTVDPDNEQTPNEVHIYIDGPAGSGAAGYNGIIANIARPDVNEKTGFQGNHGFTFDIPAQYCNGANHTAYAYGIDTGQDAPALLGGSPKTFNCTPSGRRIRYDFNGDGFADLVLLRNGNNWLKTLSPSNTFESNVFGNPGDIPVADDYDGDGRADLTMFRPSNGTWYRTNSSTGESGAIAFGLPGDIPVPADYDGDGIADISVFRPSDGYWYRLNSSTGEYATIPWGLSDDIPVPADYDGDGRAEIAIFRPSTGQWYLLNLTTGRYTVTYYGQSGDIPVPADYDGDGRADITVFRPSDQYWYLINSSTGGTAAFQFGLSTDLPVSADYDGDGKADFAVWRPSDGYWYLLGSQSGYHRFLFGNSSDTPIISAGRPH